MIPKFREMGQFSGPTFFRNLFIRLLQTVWLFKENSYFAQTKINDTFMDPEMQKYVQNVQQIQQILLKFYGMANLFGCFGKLIF